MSLHPTPLGAIPKETSRVARAAFPKKEPLYADARCFRNFFEDADVAHLFPRRGQPAECPWCVALVLVMQFMEGLDEGTIVQDDVDVYSRSLGVTYTLEHVIVI